ncbi:zeatin O-glucosyltransferase-like [Solanum dulcamara]|uniref:zeatin O-glucosyltransferase-like n=1 Tax=Solanum dulcamara TaxID=45834 RepID=UPI0024868551|nr:zeatin O-glucosyltransferase-like [Solanum dulcamara]
MEVIVVMVPYPGFSHVNQLFILARLIASHNIPVHLICLAEFNQDLNPRLKSSKYIHFNDILLTQADGEITEEYDRVVSITELLEKHNEPIRKTCLQLSINAKKLVIIYDSVMKNYMGDVHSIPNVETCIFHSGSAISKYYLLQQSVHDLDVVVDVGHEFPAMDSCYPPLMEVFLRDLHEWDLNSGEFMISSREIEGTSLLVMNLLNSSTINMLIQ